MIQILGVVTVRCNWCSKHHPQFQVHRLTTGQVICENCLDWHFHSLDFLGGGVPRGCQECGRTWEVLRDSAPGDEVRMYVVPKDGILQLLCSSCARVYLPKRPDLFAGTKFGHEVLNI